MSQLMLNNIIKDAIGTAIKLAGPILIAMLVVGLLISIIQATTQIHEQTLTFLPKVLAGAVIGVFLGSWMLNTIMEFTTRIFEMISKITT